jgi:hypothetical protein
LDPELHYDVTREMRRRAIDGTLAASEPERAATIAEALAAGMRIHFALDDETLHVVTPSDRTSHDPSAGRAIGVRRL